MAMKKGGQQSQYEEYSPGRPLRMVPGPKLNNSCISYRSFDSEVRYRDCEVVHEHNDETLKSLNTTFKTRLWNFQ